MKKLALIALASALLLTAPLEGCSTVRDLAGSTAVAATTTSVTQSNALKAAGDLYVLADHAATAALNSGKVSKDLARKMVVVEGLMHDALVAGRAADKKGDSPAVGAAVALFNSHYADLAKLVPGLGGS